MVEWAGLGSWVQTWEGDGLASWVRLEREQDGQAESDLRRSWRGKLSQTWEGAGRASWVRLEKELDGQDESDLKRSWTGKLNQTWKHYYYNATVKSVQISWLVAIQPQSINIEQSLNMLMSTSYVKLVNSYWPDVCERGQGQDERTIQKTLLWWTL